MKVLSPRGIGVAGTVARVLIGLGMLAVALVDRPTVSDIALGFVVLPGVVLATLTLRGLRATPLRLNAPAWHMVTISIFAVLVIWRPTPTFLFYGASMLVAAWRGQRSCELLAASNLLLRRDDDLGCPLFLPIDTIEAKLRGGGGD